MPGPTASPAGDPIRLTVDGAEVVVEDPTDSLLGVLRDQLGVRGPKDGCSPQGQCGCCTVLVDGAPRVACVTPVRRVRGRSVTTVDGLDAWAADGDGPGATELAEALCATGGSQCGFCTPGIVVRLAGLAARDPDADHAAVRQSLLAHLCRCTGWQTIVEAWDVAVAGTPAPAGGRDLEAATARATLEAGTPQRVGPDVALGRAGFADDDAPMGTPVAVRVHDGGTRADDDPDAWALGATLAEARRAAGKVQGRRTTEDAAPPIAVPEGDWDLVLATSWIEPAYLETDASWCEPGGTPADPLANGGAFGGKVDRDRSLDVATAARALADRSGGPVRALASREDTVRLGAKRPPLAAGLRADGTGVVRVARTPGAADAIRSALPLVTVEEVDVAGPPTSCAVRGAGWAEATALALVLAGPDAEGWFGPVTAPARSTADETTGGSGPTVDGGRAWARVADDGTVAVRVAAGDPLDAVVLRSWCIGAAHQAASWVTSEALTVDDDGEVHDLTIRSFGVLRAVDTPPIAVEVLDDDGPARPVSDAVLAAVAAAIWHGQGTPPAWPTGVLPRIPSAG